MDWPGRTDIMRRLDEEEAKEMQIQMMMAGMGSGGAMPGLGGPGGSAPKVTDIKSPHAAQGMREAQTKGNMA